MKHHYIIFALTILLFSCAGSRDQLYDTESQAEEVIDFNDLTLRLKSMPGVRVLGAGAGAQITIRGTTSLTSSIEPLYLLDDNIVNSYVDLYNLAVPSQIQKVEILRSPDETSPWGNRGANGVIRVRLNESSN